MGRAIALCCAAQGARLVLAGRSEPELHGVADGICAGGAEAEVARTDVTDGDSTEAMARQAVARYGRRRARRQQRGRGPHGAPPAGDPQEWGDMQAVNVRGVFLSCRAVLPHMIGRGAGSIVVIGSMSGKRPLGNRSPCTPSKMALVGLTRTLLSR